MVCVHTPAGQASWHIPDFEISSFQHLSIRPNDWDGHTTEEKYERLARLRSGHRLLSEDYKSRMEKGGYNAGN